MSLENILRKLQQCVRGALGLPHKEIDHYLFRHLSGHHRRKYSVVYKAIPSYRFVDAHAAVLRLVGDGLLGCVQTKGDEDLDDILRESKPKWASRRLGKSSRVAWSVGADKKSFFARNQFWVFQNARSKHKPAIIHLEYDRQNDYLHMELAAHEEELADDLAAWVAEQYVQTSIYRGQMLSVTYESGSRDSDDDVEKQDKLRLGFKVAPPIERKDFVVDDSVFGALWRNVVDLHRRRNVLKANGVPVRRGVLLYGPPGTGKTYACRYMCGELPNVTRLLVSGSALPHVGKIFQIARTYQPALIVLEDVDLIFSSREISLHSSALGDLLDQMDGLRPSDDIGVILTTNSIDRMEQAIKDRPGRISQCIFMGPPSDSLRRRYIEHHGSQYDLDEVDMPDLVKRSRGTTPAFIKEWVHRAVQMASERLQATADPAAEPLKLLTADFEAAQDEMRRFVDRTSRGIIGFVDSRR